MNDAQKNARVEMEIKAHEKEMMRKARIRKLKDASLKEKISFIISDSQRTNWKAEEMLEELRLNGLADESISEADISREMDLPPESK